MSKLSTILKGAVRHEGSFLTLINKSVSVLRREGLNGIKKRVRHLSIVSAQVPPPPNQPRSYADWLEDNDHQDTELPRWAIRNQPNRVKFSIVCPVYEPDTTFLEEAIDSVINQSYPTFELILVNDGSPNFNVEGFCQRFSDPRIKTISREENGNISAATNTGLDAVQGAYVVFMDQDDVLAEHALLWVTATLAKYPSLKLIYSDEDKLDEQGNRCDPHFKPDWNYQYFLTCNYLCHLVVVEADLAKSTKCRIGYEGAQDFDFLLRIVEQVEPKHIYHLPKLLYHWRKHSASTSSDVFAKPEALSAGLRAVQDHLNRSGVEAEACLRGLRYHVDYQVTNNEPVTIIIPTRNMHKLLRDCISSIESLTTYGNYQFLIIDNGSDDPVTLEYLDSLGANARVIRDESRFNFAYLMNMAVRESQTDLICFLNNDVEVISPTWLTELVSVISQPNVGVVGAKLLYDDRTIQHGGVILGIGGVAGHAHKFFGADDGGYYDRNMCRQELSAVTAACMLTRKSIFQSVGGMEEKSLKVAFNDVDYCLKVRTAGHKVVWTPHAQLLHHESKSRGHEDSPEKVRRFQQETDWMLDRWNSALCRDPAYNINLSLQFEDFSLRDEVPYFNLERAVFKNN